MTFLKKNLPLIIKVFLVGLLLQFLLHTFVTFKLGIDFSGMKVVWMRKELLIFLLGGFLLIYLRKSKNFKLLWQDKTIRNLQIILGISIIFILFLTLFYFQQPFSNFILAFKYDFFGFIIFFLFIHLGTFLDKNQKNKLTDFYIQVMKRSLVLAIFWWIMILYKPGILEVFFGYDRDLHESIVGAAPAATYRTNLRYGYLRNQFLFERPITFGFWLVAFWPLFYIKVLQKQKINKVWGWWLVYILNIILTFSRAAWGSWIAITGLLFLVTYNKHWKKIILGGVLSVVSLVFIVVYKKNLLLREYSNTGHIKMTLRGIEIFVAKPILGNGPSTSGPGSHQLGNPKLKFNPENQFLQILDEFGILGGGGWFIIYFFLIFTAYKPLIFLIKNSPKQKKYKKEIFLTARLIVAFAIGMIGISISGLVLHSFVDRMIVYPMMALYGLIWQKHKN